MSSFAQWARVAEGLRLVLSAAATQTSERSTKTVTSVVKHGIEVAANTRTALAAAATTLPSRDSSNISSTFVQPSHESTATMPQQVLSVEQIQIKEIESRLLQYYEVESDRVRLILRSNNNKMMKVTTPNANIPKQQSDQHYLIEAHPQDTIDASSSTTIAAESIDRSESTSQAQQAASISEAQSTDNNLDEPLDDAKSAQQEYHDDLESELPVIRQGKAVPSTQLGRAMGFASLGLGLAAGTIVEATKRLFNQSSSSSSTTSVFASDANSQRFASSLARLRGAALKLGQMLSIQEDTILPPTLAKALREVVHQGADAMPLRQLHHQLSTQLGGGDWKDKHFLTFEDHPMAAASIGQVHRATLKDGREVVVKVQYPGVAESIESDLANLNLLVKATGLAPPGLFIDEIIRVGRKEILLECDYEREMANQNKFRQLIEADESLSQTFKVPEVIGELTTKRILTTEFAPGGTIDKVANLSQEERNRIGRAVMRLTMKELFEWRFMQTDPNWGNFLYDYGTNTTYLIDFGAAREYDKSFVDGYLRIVWAAANGDTKTLLDQSRDMGFLTGEESDIMLRAHMESGLVVGEPFQTIESFDFKSSSISARLGQHTALFLRHRLTPPPEEVYTLHRKLAGAYTLCIKLGAVIPCRDLLEEIMLNYEFANKKCGSAEEVEQTKI